MRNAHVASWALVSLVLAAAACGDDSAEGSGGAGGDTGAATGTTASTTSTSSGETGGADGEGGAKSALDPDTAEVASIDRFQDGVGVLFNRTAPVFNTEAFLAVVPDPNDPIDFDELFTVQSLGPAGELITYYSFDIQPPMPAKAYVLVDADGDQIAEQLPIIETIPGDAGYNDFVRIFTVTVDDDYIANTITSAADVEASGYDVADTESLSDWVIVPDGSTAEKTFLGEDPTGYRAWYDDQVAPFLLFDEGLSPLDDGTVPTAAIVVIFANGADPSEGFATEADGAQTHNAVDTLPGDVGYSSYWDHFVGSLDGFDDVTDFASALDNDSVKVPVIVNCPVVE